MTAPEQAPNVLDEISKKIDSIGLKLEMAAVKGQLWQVFFYDVATIKNTDIYHSDHII